MAERNSPTRRVQWARRVLVVDGLGCAAATAALVLSDPVNRAVLPRPSQRPVIATALGVTSLALLSGAVTTRPTRRSLRGAALINLAWVTACLTALAHRPPLPGAVLLAGTATFDAVAGATQWTLSREYPA